MLPFKTFLLEAKKAPTDIPDRINDTLHDILHTTPGSDLHDALDKTTNQTKLSPESFEGSSRAARVFEDGHPLQRIHIQTKKGLEQHSIDTIIKHEIPSHIQTKQDEPKIGAQQTLTEVGASKMIRPPKDSKVGSIIKGPAGKSYSVADFKGIHPDGAPKFQHNPHGCLLPPVPSNNHEGYGRDGSWVHMFKVTPAEEFSPEDHRRFRKHFGFGVSELENTANSHAALNGYTFSGVEHPPKNAIDKKSYKEYHEAVLKDVTPHGMKQLQNINDLRQQRGVGDFHEGNVTMTDKHWPFSSKPQLIVLDGGYTNPRVGGGGTGTYYGHDGTPHVPMHIKGKNLRKFTKYDARPRWKKIGSGWQQINRSTNIQATRPGQTDDRYTKEE